MKKLITTLLVMMAMCLGGLTANAAFSKIYVCGAINGNGWNPKVNENLELSTVTKGWFKLVVTELGPFKVSSTCGSNGNGWSEFDNGAVCFDLGGETINGTYSSTSGNNSSAPEGTTVIYFSCDLKKCAVSNGDWEPDEYVEPSESSVDYTYCLHGNIANGKWGDIPLTESNGKWVAAKTAYLAGEFGIKKMEGSDQKAWIAAKESTAVVVNEAMDCVVGGKNFELGTAGEYTVTFDPEAMTVLFAGEGTTPTDESTVIVDATIPGWTGNVNIHYWGGATGKGSTWPGVGMKDLGNHRFSYTFTDGTPDQIIFNCNGVQTVDLDFVDGKTYVLRSKDATQDNKWCETEAENPNPNPTPDPTDENTVIVDATIPGWTSNVNIHYWGGATGDGSTWPGVGMKDLGNHRFSYTFTDGTPEKVIFSCNGEQTIDLSFVGGKTYVLRSKDATQDYKWCEEGGSQGTISGLSNTLPVLYINIYQTNEDGTFKLDGNGNKIYDNYQLQVEEIDKEYRSGEYWLDMNGSTLVPGENIGSAEEPLALEMKGRGNWTRKGFAKKPFKLKLGKKQCLLGMGEKSKHWAILAHADDYYGFMRNFTGFNLGQRIGLPWTPSQQPCEVVINGDYRGLYFLTESIRVGDGRVPIQELADNETDKDLISGGYLVELDNYEETNQIRMEEKTCADVRFVDALRITFDTPEEYSDIQRTFVREQFSTMNDLVGKANTDDGNDLWAYLDLDDAARYYLIMEICSHVESYHGSTYLFRDRGEGQKWHFSPLWDMGNAFVGPTNDYFYKSGPFGNTWIPSLLTNKKFRAKVEETWKWFMSNCYDGYMNDLDAYANQIAAAAKADNARWQGQAVPYGGQSVVNNSDIQSRKQAVKDHINAKLRWMKDTFGEYNDAEYAEPERDTTIAAPLPEYATTGIENVSVDTTKAPVYYNLQGIRVANPAAGAIYIEVRGDKTRKVAF